MLSKQPRFQSNIQSNQCLHLPNLVNAIWLWRISRGILASRKGRCSAFDMEIIFHCHANKTHFRKKGCVPSLLLKVRVFGTRKWHIAQGCCLLTCITSSEFFTNTKLVCHFNDRLFSAVATGTGHATPSGSPVRHFVFFRLKQNVIFDWALPQASQAAVWRFGYSPRFLKLSLEDIFKTSWLSYYVWFKYCALNEKNKAYDKKRTIRRTIKFDGRWELFII